MVPKLPAEDPIITGGLAHYVVGDLVKVNCTSRKSLPAANLTWYINGELSDKNFLQNYPIIEDEESGLQTIIIGLEFEVRQKHLKTGGLKIKCTATLAAVYWRSDERSAEAAAIKSAHNHSERDTQQHMSSPSKNVNDWMSNRESSFVMFILQLRVCFLVCKAEKYICSHEGMITACSRSASSSVRVMGIFNRALQSSPDEDIIYPSCGDVIIGAQSDAL
ncbi:hypothetical protein QYM36_008299 [Artemia franciscana]|uniref:CD80-like immunoglobulin C2-set domain-containing protein n=1 Tax=Artemia franciscana TaxID=6661 RepID=A0AA88IEJ3_ARTSF|nr:hypothetical protein QYM36_008299 [Artemia franciscana]